MKNPELVGRIISKMVRSVKVPVTVKIRKGFDADNVNCQDLASTNTVKEGCKVEIDSKGTATVTYDGNGAKYQKYHCTATRSIASCDPTNS